MIVKAIQKINPNAIVNVIGSDIDTCTIEWLDGTAEISKEDIKSKMAGQHLLHRCFRPMRSSQRDH